MIKRLFALLAFLLLPSWVWASVAFSGSCTGTTACTISSGVAAGHIVFAFAFRDGNATAPTIPAGVGWNIISNGAGSNNNGAAWVWREATSGSEASGTFSNANSLVMVSFSGASVSAIGGAPGTAEGSSSTVTYPDADTFTTGDGTSWVIACCGHRSADTNLNEDAQAPAGLSATNKVAVEDGTDVAACWNSNGGLTSYAGNNVAVGGTSSGWHCKSAEILQAAAVTFTPVDPFGQSGFFGM
jgi:hypothetical protein